MSMTAVRRALRIVRHLQVQQEARFNALTLLLAPISRTALSSLLREMERQGEIEHVGRSYRLGVAAVGHGPAQRGIYAMPPALVRCVEPSLRSAAECLNHSCALFGWVGVSTMKILATANVRGPGCMAFNPPGYEWPFLPTDAFARVFLVNAPGNLLRDTYMRWRRDIKISPAPASYAEFAGVLERERLAGRAIEYRENARAQLRIAVPVLIPGKAVRYAVGMVARPVYLIDEAKCVTQLKAAARAVAREVGLLLPEFQHSEEILVPQRANLSD